MLEPPAITSEQIIASLRDQYGLAVTAVTFLPLGADANTAVYRVVAADGTPYFLKLRSGEFDPLSVMLPRFLHDQGIKQIIPPLPTLSGELWGNLEAFAIILYPFIEGENGWKVRPSAAQWVEFGAALRRVHTVSVPPAWINQLQRETYSAKWRDIVRDFQARVEHETLADPISAGMADLLKTQRPVIDDIVARAERLARRLQANPPESVICHADIHLGNLLITASGAFYMVDWDAPILAPKERDLMFIGAGIGTNSTPHEDALFYEGYGATEIDPVALAYYRYERIIEDFAAYSEEILVSARGDQDRAEGLRRVRSQFLPDAVIEVAYRTDRTSPRKP